MQRQLFPRPDRLLTRLVALSRLHSEERRSATALSTFGYSLEEAALVCLSCMVGLRSCLCFWFSGLTTLTPPPATRAPRAPFASTTCAPSVPHGSVGSMRASGGMLGVHVAHFRPMCLTARNSLRHPTSPITSRTGPTRFDAWSSRGGWPEWTLGELPHVLGRHVVSWKEGHEALLPPKGEIEKLRILPAISVILYRDSPIEDSSNLGQDSKKLNSWKVSADYQPLNHTQPL